MVLCGVIVHRIRLKFGIKLVLSRWDLPCVVVQIKMTDGDHQLST